MCIVSVISEALPNQGILWQYWPPQQILDLSEVIKKLDSIDKKLGLKDCNDPIKESFLSELAKRVEAIEKRLTTPL